MILKLLKKLRGKSFSEAEAQEKKFQKERAEAKVRFEAVSDTETKIIVERGGKTYEIMALHATSQAMADFKKRRDEYYAKHRF